MRKWIIFGCCLALLTFTACNSKHSAPSSRPDSAAPSSGSTNGDSSSAAGGSSSAGASSAGTGSQSQSGVASSGSGSSAAGRSTFSDALDGMIGYGSDASGASLNSAHAATGIMDWFNDDTRDPLADPAGELSDWYDSLDDSGRQQFYENWPHIRDQARAIIEDPEGNRGLLESIDNQNDYSSMKDGWDDFVEMMERFWDENKPENAQR